MGKRGPRPEPTALKILKGNPSKRPLNDDEPLPDPSVPRCPSWLDDEAKAKWKQIVPQLKEMGVLTRIDSDALVMLCTAWSRWKDAEEFIEKHGNSYPSYTTDEDGKKVLKNLNQFPEVTIAKNLYQVVNRLHGEFGMTPSSRSSIKVSDSTVDEFEEFLTSNKENIS